MAIPISYNIRNLAVRKTTTLMTAAGIAMTVAVLLAVLGLVSGLQTALSSTGDPLHLIVMRKGGRIVILDLLSHRFERARELYADHWLGFSEVQLHQFLEDAGFKNIEVTVVSREKQSPHFQTVFATGIK